MLSRLKLGALLSSVQILPVVIFATACSKVMTPLYQYNMHASLDCMLLFCSYVDLSGVLIMSFLYFKVSTFDLFLPMFSFPIFLSYLRGFHSLNGLI